MSNELKPCPFCVGSASISPNTFGDGSSAYYRAECEEGHCLDHWDDNLKEAAETWNNRAKFSTVEGMQLVSEASIEYLHDQWPTAYKEFYARVDKQA